MLPWPVSTFRILSLGLSSVWALGEKDASGFIVSCTVIPSLLFSRPAAEIEFVPKAVLLKCLPANGLNVVFEGRCLYSRSVKDPFVLKASCFISSRRMPYWKAE